MRTIRAAAALAACAVLLPAVASATPSSLLSGVTYDAAATTRLYSLTNAHRRATGLPALASHAGLTTIARTWTTSMATTGTLAHNDALFTRETHALLRITSFGENVAFASRGVDSAFQSLLDSPHHRENIENGAYAVAGFAVVRDAKGVTWVTQDFGSRPTAVAAAPAPAPRPAAPRVTAPAPRPRPAARPVAPPARRAVLVRPAAPAARAVPAYVPPATPRRESPAGAVDLATGTAPVDAATAVPVAATPVAAGSPAEVPPALPLAAAAAVLLVGTLTGVAGARGRRSSRLGA